MKRNWKETFSSIALKAVEIWENHWKIIVSVASATVLVTGLTVGGVILFTSNDPSNNDPSYEQGGTQREYTDELGLKYRMSKDGTHYYLFEGEECELKEVAVPATVDGLPVREIAYNAFKNCKQLTFVRLSDEVQTVATSAFNGCANLKEVVLGSGLTVIEDGAFTACEKLQTVDLSACDQLQTMGSNVFTDCVALKTVDLSNTQMTVLPKAAFYGCVELESVLFPATLTKIGESAFVSCEKMTQIDLPTTVTTIGKDVFGNCLKLGAVYYQGTLEQWCAVDFENVYSNPLVYAHGLYIQGEKIDELTVPVTLQTLKPYLFAGGDFTSVVLGEGLQTIGTQAFYSCAAIGEIYLPASLKAISDGAFRYCYNLAEIRNASSLEIEQRSSANGYIGFYAKRITGDQSTKIDKQSDFRFFVDGEDVSLIGYDGDDSHLILPDGYKGKTYSISNGAFYANKKIESVTVPVYVRSIGSLAFYGCSNLENVTIQGGVKSIDESAFQYCTALESISIPSSVESIGVRAFYRCDNLRRVNFASGLTTIDAYAFYGCGSLQSVDLPDSLKTLGKYAFTSCERLQWVDTGDGLEEIKEATFGACYVVKHVRIGKNVKRIGTDAFLYCHRLFEIENESVVELRLGSTQNGSIAYFAKNIYGTGVNGGSKLPAANVNGFEFFTLDGQHYLFNYTGNQSEIVLPESYNGEAYHVYDYAFMNRRDITRVTVSSGVRELGEDAFAYMENLEELVFEEGLEKIGTHAIRSNPKLHTITLPKTLKTICDDSFTKDVSLTKIVFGGTSDDWAQIIFESESANPFITGADLYVGGERVEKVTLTSSLTEIKPFAFCGALGIYEVFIPASVTSIGKNAFGDSTLSKVKFEDPADWQTANNNAISEFNLGNEEKAARLLRLTYKSYTLIKK